MKTTDMIDKRYSSLAKSTSCLSCGGAIRYCEPSEGEICVDLGSGRGKDVITLAQKVGATGHVYGIDIATGMLEIAQGSAHDAGVQNVSFVYSEIESIKLDDNGVDLLISNCTINHAKNKNAVWSEVYRILKPGGRFVVSDIYATEEVPEKYKNDPAAVSQCWGGAVTREAYFDTLNTCGFVDVTILEESQPYTKAEIQVASITIKGYKPKK